MAARQYRLTGIVRNQRTHQGVPGLRVEAWDRDVRYHDLLGCTVTDGEGRFAIGFDETYFGDHGPDRLPDVYFRVLQDDRVIRSTEGSVIRNLADPARDVIIDVDLPGEEEAAPDRVSAAQIYGSITWLKQSDFRGAFNDGVDRVKTFGRLSADLAKGVLARTALTPLVGPSVRDRDVVGQDVVTAGANLATQNVAVQEVKTYTPGEGVRLLDFAKTAAVPLKPGDRVTLYQENGIVRYYTLVRDPAPKDIQAADVARLDGEVKAVRADLTELAAVKARVDEVKAASEARSSEITTSVESVKQDLAAMAQMKTEMETLHKNAVERERQIKDLQDQVATLKTSLNELSMRGRKPGAPSPTPPQVRGKRRPPSK